MFVEWDAIGPPVFLARLELRCCPVVADVVAFAFHYCSLCIVDAVARSGCARRCSSRGSSGASRRPNGRPRCSGCGLSGADGRGRGRGGGGWGGVQEQEEEEKEEGDR